MAGSRDRREPEALRAAAQGLDFRIRPSGVRRLVRKGAKRSLIELVSVSGLDEYCARLGTPVPPSHVTLFTEPGGGGIALYCAADLDALSVEADLSVEPGPWRLDADGAILEA